MAPAITLPKQGPVPRATESSSRMGSSCIWCICGGGLRCAGGVEALARAGLVAGVNLDVRRRGTNWSRRSPRYPVVSEDYLSAVEEACGSQNIPTYRDSVNGEMFWPWMSDRGARGILSMSFGEKFSQGTIAEYHGWVINTHPVAVGEDWPSPTYGGPVPYEEMYLAGAREAQIVAHAVNTEWDRGFEIARSKPFELEPYSGPPPQRRGRTFVATDELGRAVRANHARAVEVMVKLLLGILPRLEPYVLDGTPASYDVVRSVLGQNLSPPKVRRRRRHRAST